MIFNSCWLCKMASFSAYRISSSTLSRLAASCAAEACSIWSVIVVCGQRGHKSQFLHEASAALLKVC